MIEIEYKLKSLNQANHFIVEHTEEDKLKDRDKMVKLVDDYRKKGFSPYSAVEMAIGRGNHMIIIRRMELELNF